MRYPPAAPALLFEGPQPASRFCGSAVLTDKQNKASPNPRNVFRLTVYLTVYLLENNNGEVKMGVLYFDWPVMVTRTR